MTAPGRGGTRRGFALVLTLSLLALLMLAVYALSVLVRTSGQVADAGARQARARQQALLGLSVALRELQQGAGPDEVVTARSSVRAVSTTYGCLLGVWPASSGTAAPANWYVSGNFAPDSARSIDQASLPDDLPTTVTLVGAGSATSGNYAWARRIAVADPLRGIELGGYAFWIGDEGAKASLNVPEALAPRSPAGAALVANPTGEIPSFRFGDPAVARVLTTEQIRAVAPGAALKARFHDYAARSEWVGPAGTMQPGRFNVNTTSRDSWAAVLRAYDAARPADAPALGDGVGRLAAALVGNLGSATAVGGKVRFGPFRSMEAFWASGLVQASLDEIGLTEVVQADLEATLSPMLAVRSDTFRIRAYGDSVNPVNGKREGVAVGEAIVQRMADRQFRVVYFRWLGPDEI